jgi:mRNA interferase RelE/StbE
MTYRIEVKCGARKALLALPQAYRVRIGESIKALAHNPLKAGTRKLEGSERLYRLRVGDYRIVYEIRDDCLVMFVVKVGHRRKLVQDPARLGWEPFVKIEHYHVGAEQTLSAVHQKRQDQDLQWISSSPTMRESVASSAGFRSTGFDMHCNIRLASRVTRKTTVWRMSSIPFRSGPFGSCA